MSINWQEILFHFLGGLGLFLYSIKTMGGTVCNKQLEIVFDFTLTNILAILSLEF